MGNSRKIDEIDSCILKTLLKDARTSFIDIAQKCKIQPNVIRTHYNRLKQDGVITGEMTEINPHYLGYDCVAIVGLRVDPEKTASIISKLEKISIILQTAKGVGGENLLCFTIAHDLKQLNKTIEQLREIEGVTAVDSEPVVFSSQSEFPENLQLTKEDH